MSRPRLLDLFAGAQGAGVGYARAGFEVHAIDIEAHDRHPEVASFTVADAMDVLADVDYCRGFDVVHASPPCQFATQMSARWRGKGTRADEHVDLLTPTLARLRGLAMPWVVENVPGARRIMRDPLILHGGMFGLGVHRPRLFESSAFLMVYRAPATDSPLGVYGKPDGRTTYRYRNNGNYKGKSLIRAWKSLEEGSAAMGIDWMDIDDLREAIPPAYTQFIGEQLLDALAGEDLPHPVPGQPADGRDLLLGNAVLAEHPHRLMQRGAGAAVVPQSAAGGVGGHGSGPDVKDQREVAVLVTVSAEVDPHPHGVGTEQLGDGQSAADVAVGLVGGERAGDRRRHADESALLVGTLSTTSRQVAS